MTDLPEEVKSLPDTDSRVNGSDFYPPSNLVPQTEEEQKDKQKVIDTIEQMLKIFTDTLLPSTNSDLQQAFQYLSYSKTMYPFGYLSKAWEYLLRPLNNLNSYHIQYDKNIFNLFANLFKFLAGLQVKWGKKMFTEPLIIEQPSFGIMYRFGKYATDRSMMFIRDNWDDLIDPDKDRQITSQVILKTKEYYSRD